ncbi:MAG: hypothetical protein V3W41_13880 [Planctomycetota bacterium]
MSRFASLALSFASLVGLFWLLGPDSLIGGYGAAKLVAPVETVTRAGIFPHSKHVSRQWITKGETKRDCQICHDFTTPNHEPASACVSCHYNQQGSGAATLSVQGRVANYQRTMPSFKHEDHVPKGMDCAECHVDPNSKSKFMVDEIWIPRGLGWCTKCHDPSSNRAYKFNRAADKPAVHQGFQRKINGSPGMVGKPSDVFLHSDHLSSSELRSGSPKVCDSCHQGMATADPMIGEKLFRESDCTACHLAGANQPMRIGIQEVAGAKPISKADYTFLHADHLSAKALKKDGRLGRQGCFVCHDYKASAVSEGDRYPVKPRYQTFAGCVECHKQGSVGGGIARDIPDHGEVDNCFGCHSVGGEDTDMKTNRPLVEIDRRHPGDFRFLSHAHPHITGADGKTRSCTECHVSERHELPSRIRQKPFKHKPHLNSNAKLQTAECAACHTAAKEHGRMEMGVVEGGHINYEAKSCLECHREVGKTELSPLSFKSRKETVVLFSHHDHLSEAALALDPALKEKLCLACHESQDSAAVASTGHDYGYAQGTLDCLACHDHQSKYKQTGNVDQNYVEGCMACHEVGVPAKGSELPIRRIEARGLGGTQFHPLPQEKACAACHKLQPMTMIGGDEVAALTQVRGTRVGYPNNGFHRLADGGGAKLHDRCLECHWHQANSPVYKMRHKLGKSETVIRKQYGSTLGPLPAGR